ncbi:MAG: proline--tRNA ligase [Pseudonocardiaceae bacterium]
MSTPSLLTPRRTDFPRWYQDVIARAELADNGPVRGTMVIRPTGYALWERMQREIDDRIKAVGAQNAYFPLLIPESYLHREAEHVEGFSPELAVVTHAGGKQLDESVVIRPTSETIINSFFARWVQSYRDLPLKLNNWSNAVRWELRPRLFLRTTEFLWQEGHTCHATEAQARGHAREVLTDVYGAFMTDVLAIPVILGRKTARERFAGATNTMTCEAMMGDGKALQMGTSHELGQNFARAFDVQFLAASGQREYVWQTSWGVSTRMVGGLIMCHGDDAGLRVPPRLAPIQAIVLVVKDDAEVRATAHQVVSELREAGIRVALDERTDVSFGRRAIDAELKGVPVRIELGPRDITAGKAVLVRRIPGTKEPVALTALAAEIISALDTDQRALHDQALARREAASPHVESLNEAREAAAHGWARIPWSVLGEPGEAALAEHAVTVRCLTRPDGSLPERGDEPDLIAWVARSY